MPIVGSFAGASARAYGLGAGVLVGDFESISTVTVGTATATVTFSSIPATYSHLQVRVLARSADTGAGGVDNLVMSFNSDTTYTNYRSHFLTGNGTTASSGTLQVATYFAYCGDMANSVSSNTQIYGGAVIDILDYANTNKNKTVRSIAGTDRNGSGAVALHSSVWLDASAISSIVLRFPTANISVTSSFALYGVKT